MHGAGDRRKRSRDEASERKKSGIRERDAAFKERYALLRGYNYRRIATLRALNDAKAKIALDKAREAELPETVSKAIREKRKREDSKLERLYDKQREADDISVRSPNKRRRKVTIGDVPLVPSDTVIPGRNYPKITNIVVTVHFGMDHQDLHVDQKRISVYVPNSVKNGNFAAAIIPQNSATALFFSNYKTVMTGTSTEASAMLALQMYRLTLGKVKQPVLLYNDDQDPPVETHELCYLRSLLDFTGFMITNIVGCGPIAEDGYTVDLASLMAAYPETNWAPEIFPGLKFRLPVGNSVTIGGKKCTAHIFETRIVLMGLENTEDIQVAYEFFLDLVKKFLIKSTSAYEDDRYNYRYTMMLKRRNGEITEEETRKEAAASLETAVADGDVDPEGVPIGEQKIETAKPEAQCRSLFDFSFAKQLPPDLLKKMKRTMKTAAKATSASKT
jgi:TATA-box binding protein (TBP) (component of TFIID and TFIIIB)